MTQASATSTSTAPTAAVMNEGGFGYWDENDNTRAMLTGENIGCHDDNGNMRAI